MGSRPPAHDANTYHQLLAHAVVRPAYSSARNLAARSILKRAERALDELDEAEAMSQLRAALRIDPRCESARMLLDALTHPRRV